MANDVRLSDSLVNTEATAAGAEFNSGYIRIYDGTRPTNADTAVGAQNLLAELRFNATAFGSPTAGVLTAGAITADASANASGTAAWARLLKSDGTTVLADVEVGTSGADINLNSVAITAGASVSITSMTFTVTK